MNDFIDFHHRLLHCGNPGIFDDFAIHKLVFVDVYVKKGVIEAIERFGFGAGQAILLFVDADALLRQLFDDTNFAVDDLGQGFHVTSLGGQLGQLIIGIDRVF